MRARTGTTIGAIVVVLGVLLLVAAALLAWWVVPNLAKLPTDTNTTRQYDGTAKMLLNAQALATGNPSAAIIANVPVTASRTVKVLATSGNAAEVSDARTLQAGGRTIGQTTAMYAVDRKTLENPGSHPSDWNVIDQQGLTVSWPIGAKQQDYQGWVNETQTTTPLRYVREEQHGGVNTYVYEAAVPASPIKNEQALAALPQALPVSALGALSAVLPIPDDVKAKLASVLPTLTQPIPLSYTYESQSTYWIEPTTGIVVDSRLEEIRKAGITLPGSSSPALSVPVYDVVTQNTSQSVTDAANDATDAKKAFTLVGRTLPLILAAIGVIALIIGVLLILLPRRRTAPPPA